MRRCFIGRVGVGGWVGGWVGGPDGLMREARDTVVGLQKGGGGRVVDLHEEVLH